MKILYVCTANICRSASAAHLLEQYLKHRDVPGVEILSAGTHARTGMPGCGVAPALHGVEHSSQPLTAELLMWADLVLPAARDHLPTVTALEPAARKRTFTIRQSGRIADWMLGTGIVPAAAQRRGMTEAQWAEHHPRDDPRHFVTPLPTEPAERGHWLAEEMDAARGLVPLPPISAPEKPSRWRRKADASEPHPDDVPDPHELGDKWHDPAYQYIAEATERLAALLGEVQGAT